MFEFRFCDTAPAEEIEATIVLTLLALESLHGEAKVRLEARHHFDSERRTCLVDATSQVGQDFARLLTGFARREYGDDGFSIRHLAAREFAEAGQ